MRTHSLPAYPVAPYAGAWIEISDAYAFIIGNGSPPMRGRGLKCLAAVGRLAHSVSPPMRGRGLKYQSQILGGFELVVAPYAGAWIEIVCNPATRSATEVAPYAGAWIEIGFYGVLEAVKSSGRPLCGGVD